LHLQSTPVRIHRSHKFRLQDLAIHFTISDQSKFGCRRQTPLHCHRNLDLLPNLLILTVCPFLTIWIRYIGLALGSNNYKTRPKAYFCSLEGAHLAAVFIGENCEILGLAKPVSIGGTTTRAVSHDGKLTQPPSPQYGESQFLAIGIADL